MLLLFPARRLGLLEKSATDGGERPGHKYWKRQRVYAPKLHWRYWYHDDADRQAAKKDLDPHGHDEHVTRAEAAAKLYPNLRVKRRSTASITTSFLEGLLGVGGKPGRTTVRYSAAFAKQHINPAVAAEKGGLEPDRNPIQRVAQALEMLSEPVKKLLSLQSIEIVNRDEARIKEHFERGADAIPVPAAFSDKHNITLCADGAEGTGAGFNSPPSGDAKFGRSLTLSEEILWHEIGSHLRERLSTTPARKEMLDKFRKIAERPALTKPSVAANQNWIVDFAESFAAMMSHPREMARRCPERYVWFQESGLVNVPPLADMLLRPAAEFAWWEGAELTNTGRMMHRMIERIAESPRTTYVSDQDEYYSVTGNGRTVYFVAGPASASEEDSWRPLPPILDPKTNVPVYVAAVAQRFRAKGIVKEVYDELGRRLDDTSAFFYLRQEEAIDGLPETLAEYGKLGAKSGDGKVGTATHGLGYQIYTMLGVSVGTGESEAVKDMSARTLASRELRWQWAPVKMTEEEFHTKTPTFTFARMREAVDQPFVQVAANGKDIISPRTKKPMLATRLYTSVNPDGSITEIGVREAADFVEGEIVLLPVTVEAADGSETTEWEPTELTRAAHGDDFSAKTLSKRLRVTVDDLLSRNGKTGQYQIEDPMLAALVNPDNRPLATKEDLIAALRFAAEARVPRWVTIELPDDRNTHIHLKAVFDGNGSPLLVGDYWERKLGKVAPRISDLVASSMELRKVGRAREIPVKREPIVVGKPLFVQIAKKLIQAILVSKNAPSSGKKVFTVRILPDQEVPEQVMDVSQVQGIADDLDLDRPSIRRRKFRAPANDLLLYADDVSVTPSGDPIPGSGVVKIKLPLNGQFTFEEIARSPGVRVTNGELVLDPNEVSAFRDHVGGFLMDDYVRIKMHKQLEAARVLEEAGRKPRVSMSRICDSIGTVNTGPKGLLKGMRESVRGQPLRLGSHQALGLQHLAQSNGRIMFAWGMGTGKTIGTIAGIKLLQNLSKGKQARKTLVVAPKGVVVEWFNSVAEFTTGRATLLGAGLPGAVRVWTPPKELQEKPAGWSEDKYQAALRKARKAATGASLWDPSIDKNDIAVVSDAYFTEHESELRRTGGFDTTVIDEAQGVQRDNKKSAAIARWNADLNTLIYLTGTPITNTMATLANYVRTLSNGEVDWGTADEFEKMRMVESAVLKASGAKTAAKMDINPTMLAELLPALQQYIDVRGAEEVTDRVMPLILTDENSPEALSRIGTTVYRGYMKQMTEADRSRLESGVMLGEDEQAVLSPEGRRSIRIARAVTNTPGYKPVSLRREVTYEKLQEGKGDKAARAVDEVLKLPTYKTLVAQFGGKFPSQKDVDSGKLQEGHFAAIGAWFGHALGRDYDTMGGRKPEAVLTAKELAAYKASGELGNGIVADQKIPNPEFGPEGAICRGTMDASGKVHPLERVIRDAKGKVIDTIKVPVGTKFVRNPLRNSATEYYLAGLPVGHPEFASVASDWDDTRAVIVRVRKEREAAGTEDEDEDESLIEGAEKGQRPLPGHDKFNVNKSIERRRERVMLDMVLTMDNAKCDAMERWIADTVNPKTGNPDAQMVVFTNSLSSSYRTAESKMRMLGYKDVNEELNEKLRAPGDRPPDTGYYYVTFSNDAATLGNRVLNSDIFRRAQVNGRNTKTSMLVHMAMYGTSGKQLKPGAIVEPWVRDTRDDIAKAFPSIEPPSRVSLVSEGGKNVYKYAYDSDVSAKDRAKINKLEASYVGSTDYEAAHAAVDAIYANYFVTRAPMTEAQISVFDRCRFMVATDAAQVGMNWGNGSKLAHYDSLFSPFAEDQRATRIARLLPELVHPKFKPTFDRLDAKIRAMGKKTNFSEYEGSVASAATIVEDAIEGLSKNDQILLNENKVGAAQFARAYLAQSALTRLQGLRSKVGQRLRTEGRVLTGAPKVQTIIGEDPETKRPIYGMASPVIKAVEINEGDITNEMVENELQPFERELLRSMGALKDMRRFTTSVEVPEMETRTVEVISEYTGKMKKKKVRVPTGRLITESPSHAEQSVITRARAKKRPVEALMSAIQGVAPVKTRFDFVSSHVESMARLAVRKRPVMTAADRAAANKRRKEAEIYNKQEHARHRKELLALAALEGR